MHSNDILVTRDDGVAILTLNRPDRYNAWTRAMRNRLAQEVRGLMDDESVKAMVFTGAGDRGFSTGQDFNESQGFDGDATSRAWLYEIKDLYDLIRRIEKPTVAALNGIAAGSGFQFENEVVGGSVPKEYIPGVEKGIRGSLDNGVLAGFPVIDLKVELTDGAYHEVDSSALAFEIAARAAMKEGLAKAAPKLLEPVMRVEVVTPKEYMGDVIGDLNSRRGRITGQDQRGNAEVINAMVPLANMFGYVNNLRSMSQGRAQYTMHFDHYEQVPQAVADEVRAKMA